MKPSRWNFVWPAEDGRLLLFNSFTIALVEAPAVCRGLLESEGLEPEALPERERRALDGLKRGGFFVADETDEIDALKAAVDRLKDDGTSLDLTIAPTLRCNFACVYCYEQDVPGEASRQGRHAVMPEAVRRDLLARLERECDRIARLNVLWFGGEPLMGLSVVVGLSRAMIRLAEDKGVAYRAGMVTNGYGLDAEAVRKLADCRLAFAQVTVDGPPAVHDGRRMLKKSGGPTFERVVEGVKRLAESGVAVTVRVNVDETNREAALDVPDCLAARGVRNVSITIGRVVPYTAGCASVADDCLTTAAFADLDRAIKARAAAAGFTVASFLSYPTSVNVACIARRAKPMVIDPDGEIYKCWNEIGNAERRIGNLADFDARSEAEAAREARWVEWSVFDEPRCRDCKLLPMCLGGCAYGPIVNGAEPECTSWKHNFEAHVKARYAREKAARSSPRAAAEV